MSFLFELIGLSRLAVKMADDAVVDKKRGRKATTDVS